MKLLIVTQIMDSEDPGLGFFHDWVVALAPYFERITVVCLKKGTCSLPGNVSVYSLGKEDGAASPATYSFRFLGLAWRRSPQYDRVFVHMNQEYLLIAGWFWKLLGKRMYLWRNHYAGSWLTDVAAAFCTKVFCTSKHSYTAKYAKTLLMPVGIDLERFSPEPELHEGGVLGEMTLDPRVPHSILFLARMSPSKRPDMLLEALGILFARGTEFTATLIGSPTAEDVPYYESLKVQALALGLEGRVVFSPGIPNAEAALAYAAHDIFVNASRSGMFDKTLFEAAASGCLVLAVSDDFKDAAGEQYHFADAAELAEKLEILLSYTETDRFRACQKMYSLARAENLATLAERLSVELSA